MKTKILYLVCFAYFLAGLNVYRTKIPKELIVQADPSVSAHLRLFSFHQIGATFMLVTAVCVLLALTKRVARAYSMMTFLLMFWALLYVVSWSDTGYWQSVYGMANYALTASILILCSKIAECSPEFYTSMATPLPIAEINFRLDNEGKT